MHQVKVVWQELSILRMVALIQKKLLLFSLEKLAIGGCYDLKSPRGFLHSSRSEIFI